MASSGLALPALRRAGRRHGVLPELRARSSGLPRDEALAGGPAVSSGESLRDPPSTSSDRPPEPRPSRDGGERIREGTLLGRLFLPGLLVLLLFLAGAWVLGWGPFGRGGDDGPITGGPTATATASSPFLPAVAVLLAATWFHRATSRPRS